MKWFRYLSLFISIELYGMGLVEYIHQALSQSYEAQMLRDNAKLSKLNLSSVVHRYDVVVTPDSALSIDEYGDRVTVGLQGSQANTYGGKIYSSLSTTQSKSTISNRREYSLKSSIGYTQSIFGKFGSQYNTLSLYKVKEREKLSKIEIDEAKKDIVFWAISKYYSVILRREQIAIYNLATKRAEHNYNSAKAKQEAGIVSKIDVHRAKLSYLSAKRNEQDALKNYKNALSEATFFIDSDEKRDIFSEEIKKVSYRFSIDWDKIIDHSAKWKIIRINEDILNREIYNANRDMLPDIKVDVKYHSYSQDDRFRDSLEFDNKSWSLSLSSDYSFDSNDEEIAIERLKIAKNRIFQDKKRVRRVIKKEIEELFNEFENIKETLNIERLKEREARESLNVAQIRYERGLSSNIDVLDAESNMLNAQISSAGALVRYNSAIFRLAKSLNLLDADFVAEALR
ncbi:TolC family protein [Sulfurovum sp. bin170]|uniref:TolC family protein n=1 Tax=Sulfurovum sp. bin170 TaxID=2695268 RepID=UPI0013E07DEE|nr:TolC family protein [Sulfurovum sp. bin170]NEW61158.1 TolC family protein [Sulfurovum sp. bin170]